MFEDNDHHFYKMDELLSKVRNDETISPTRRKETLDLFKRQVEQELKSYNYIYDEKSEWNKHHPWVKPVYKHKSIFTKCREFIFN